MQKPTFEIFVLLAALVCAAVVTALGISDLEVSVNTKVVLIGFDDGDGAFSYKIDANPIHELLSKSMSVHSPWLRGSEGHERIGVRYKLKYEVVHLRLEYYKDELYRQMQSAALPKADNTDITRYSIMNISFYDLMHEALQRPGSDKYIDAKDDEGEHFLKNEYMVFVVNLNPYNLIGVNPVQLPEDATLSQIVQTVQIPRYGYVMGADDAVPSSVFVGLGNFVVVDVNAVTANITKLASKSIRKPEIGRLGGVGIPNLSRFLNEHAPVAGTLKAFLRTPAATTFAVDIASIVQSAVTQVFLPDIKLETQMYASDVIVPILVLRNHDIFNPLQLNKSENGKDDEYLLNVNRLETVVRNRMVPNSKKISFVYGVHFLHDHPQLALAFQKSIETTPETATSFARVSLNMASFMKHLGESTDFLSSTIVNLPVNLDKSLNSDNTEDHSQTYSSPTLRFLQSQLHSSSSGIRIVPVFIFSLLDPYNDLLIDGESNVASTRDAVVVVQTKYGAVATSYGTDPFGEPLVFNVRLLQSSVTLGLFQAISGIASPLQRIETSKKQPTLEEDLTWFMGYHPFVLWQSAPRLVSSVMMSLPLRNALFSRLHVIRLLLVDITTHLDNFDKTFGLSALGEIYHSSFLHLRPGDFEPNSVIKNVVKLKSESLNGEVQQRLDIYKRLADDVQQAKIRSAYRDSGILLESCLKLRSYVLSDLSATATGLSCCFNANVTAASLK